MINGKRVLALIPARGGSKGIPKKNIIDVSGRPLIYYTIDASLKSHYIDETIVSTDSEEIAEISRENGAKVPFLRDETISNDTAKSIDVVIDAINKMKEQGERVDILIFLQPTSPLRTTADIDGALETFIENDSKPLTSVVENDKYPLLIRTIENGTLHSLLSKNSSVRRQDITKTYYVNGAIYIIKIEDIKPDTSLNDGLVPYFMSKRNSCDIDDYDDLELVNYYLNC
jgi:CMP-N-acetylneuraminic acid synthetase